jgi:hypothetical protein
MILKVTSLIWNMNTALSRLFGKQRLVVVKNRRGAVKKPAKICDAPPQHCHASARIPCRKISQRAIFA